MDPTCKQVLSLTDIIKGFIAKNQKLFMVYLVFLLLLPLQDIGMPHMFGKLIQSIKDRKNLTYPLIIIISIMVIMQIGYSLADYVEIKMFPAIQKHTRELMMMHLMDIQRTNYEELKLGEITTKLIKLPAAVYIFIDQWKNLFIPQAIVFTFAIGYFFVHEKIIGISLLLLVISLVITILISMRKCEQVSKQRDKSFNDIYEEVDDVLRNVVTVLNFEQEKQEVDRIDTKHKLYQELCEGSLHCALRVRYIFLPIILGYLMFFTYYSYNRVKQNKLQLAVFISMFIIMLQLTGTMWRIIGSVKDMVVRWGIIQESLDVFRKCPRRQRPVETLEQPIPGIVFKNVGYSYVDQDGAQRQVMENFNLWLRPQERVLIVGKIGSGKTTILRLIMKYLEPQYGEIFIDSVPYYDVSPEYIRKRVGYIPQNPILFNRTIYENITYGLDNVTRQDVINLLYRLGVYELVDKTTHGLDTEVGKYGSKLSGGQRQIVWIVRTMLQNPDIVVMDEPTSAIDESTKDTVQLLLRIMMQDKTVVMVTHDPFLTKFADRVIEISDGAIVRDKTQKNQ